MFSYSISLTISYKKIVVIKLIQSKKHSPLVPDFDTTLVLVVHSRRVLYNQYKKPVLTKLTR
jgi:hypothetical protein